MKFTAVWATKGHFTEATAFSQTHLIRRARQEVITGASMVRDLRTSSDYFPIARTYGPFQNREN